jgi:hypothetical protein
VRAKFRSNDLKHDVKSSLGVAVESVLTTEASRQPFRRFRGVGPFHPIPKLSSTKLRALVSVLRSGEVLTPHDQWAWKHVAEKEVLVAEGDDGVGRRVDFHFEST